MRKICIVTGTRAEYGLLYWLMKEIRADAALRLQIIATGMHLSPVKINSKFPGKCAWVLSVTQGAELWKNPINPVNPV